MEMSLPKMTRISALNMKALKDPTKVLEEQEDIAMEFPSIQILTPIINNIVVYISGFVGKIFANR